MRLRIAVLLACGVLVYWNALPAPFLLDDMTAIVGNPTIRQLSPLSAPLQPPADRPVTRRPLVNLSFALNYAAGGVDPWGYHAVNLVIHLLAALLLFAIVRRTLLTYGAGGSQDPPLRDQALPDTPFPEQTATNVAWVTAVLWALHPLNSEMVDYVTQRSESLMALAYLLTMYCAIRAWPTSRPAAADRGRRARRAPPAIVASPRWEIAAVVSCAAGMLCKESMVTAPVMVVLYDRIFLSDSWRVPARRLRLYAGLAASWVILAALLVSGRRRTAGFGTGISVLAYLLNQVRLISRYLYLAVWPHSLVVDYGLTPPIAVHDVVLPGILLALLLVAGVVLFMRSPRIGFGLVWCLITLAPTSSIVPIATEVGAERRMYLPMAGLVATAVVGAYLLLRRVPWRVQAAVAAIVCLLAGVGTYLRNREYLDPLTLARVTVERWPSGRSHFYYGTQLIEAGRTDDGIAQFRLSSVTYPGGQYALGSELVGAGHIDEGLDHLREFIRLAPNDDAVSPARDLMGRVFMTRNQFDAAAEQFNLILLREPGNVRALTFLGDVRMEQGRYADAIAAYARAVAGDPHDPDIEKRLGQALAISGRIGDAVPHFRRALELAPNDAQAREFLDAAVRQAGQPH